VGVSFSGKGGFSQGVLVTAAIGAHNIPEGMAVATVLVQKGTSPARAVMWAIATSLPQPLLAVPSFIFVETFQVLPPCSSTSPPASFTSPAPSIHQHVRSRW
jgi:zinc transporter ZupT